MGDDQLGRADRRVVVEQDVDVEGAGAVVAEPPAAGRRLDPLALAQQGERVERGVHGHHHVEERTLALGAADRIGLVHRRQGGDRAQTAHREAEVGPAVAEVRPEGQHGPMRGWCAGQASGLRAMDTDRRVVERARDRRSELADDDVDGVDPGVGEHGVRYTAGDPFEQQVVALGHDLLDGEGDCAVVDGVLE
jgi:hypothetical protein